MNNVMVEEKLGTGYESHFNLGRDIHLKVQSTGTSALS